MNEQLPLPYFYRLVTPTGHDELAEMELRAIVGEATADPTAGPDCPDRIRWARGGADVRSAAYVAEACRALAVAPDREGLLREAANLGLEQERFRITVRRIGGQDIAVGQEFVIGLANLIEGRPDLDRPVREFVVIARRGAWLLGELVSRADSSWLGHEQRPHQYSAALPPRIARALVNLVAAPGDRLLDPCCGVGTVLVEAAQVGIEAHGREINEALVEHARGNVCHWGLKAEVETADGRSVTESFDAGVLDLPYGHSVPRVEATCRELVATAAEHCRMLAVVSGDDMRSFMTGLGLEVLGLARVHKGGVVRHVHWAGCG